MTEKSNDIFLLSTFTCAFTSFPLKFPHWCLLLSTLTHPKVHLFQVSQVYTAINYKTSICCGDSPQSLQALQHVPLDVFVFFIALQQRDGVVVVLAVELVHLFQLSFEMQEDLP